MHGMPFVPQSQSEQARATLGPPRTPRPWLAMAGMSLLLLLPVAIRGQTPPSPSSAVTREKMSGGNIAKNGFANEDEIRDKFNQWQSDRDAQEWLQTMGYPISDIVTITAVKPHGKKADVEVRVKTQAAEKTEGISIKLVHSPRGFNQIDKRWLAQYVPMWHIPPSVVETLQRFVGESPPTSASRDPQRMFLDEFPAHAQQEVVDFFSAHREAIVAGLLAGDGPHRAGWMLVTDKSPDHTRWTLHPMPEVLRFFGEGPVHITRHGNLKIGRITMQRKGGDGGQDTAQMLQFKINPALLFQRDAPPAPMAKP